MRIGITGGIGTGKTTVASYLRDNHGLFHINADDLGHIVCAPNGPAYPELVKHFIHLVPGLLEGVDTGMRISRKNLAAYVFSRPDRLEELNAICHPHVRELFRCQAKLHEERHPETPLLYDVPLLYECGVDAELDVVIATWCPQEIQIERVMNRSQITRQMVLRRIMSQLSAREKAERADYIIRTHINDWSTKAQADSVLTRIAQQFSFIDSRKN